MNAKRGRGPAAVAKTNEYLSFCKGAIEMGDSRHRRKKGDLAAFMERRGGGLFIPV